MALVFALSGGDATATPGSGATTTTVGRATMPAVHVNAGDFTLRQKHDADAVTVVVSLDPGGTTGWHSHPGPSIVSVVSGQATEYRSDDPNGTVYSKGTAFADEGGDHAHIVVNEGTTDLVLIAFQILPKGATRRIDKPAP